MRGHAGIPSIKYYEEKRANFEEQLAHRLNTSNTFL